ncbi:MAG: HAD family hydrolase, partial [Candidatus Omnitrophota bacterium]
NNIDTALLDNLLVLACNGTQMFAYNQESGVFDNIYIYPLGDEIGAAAMDKLIGKANERDNPNRKCILTDTLKYFEIPLRVQNDQIDNRISQVTFYGIGKKATREERATFNDTDRSKRKPWRDYIAARCLKEGIPVDLVIGGQTSIDILPRGIDKGYAIDTLVEFFGISPEQMLFFGDSFTIFGNDRAAMLKVGLSVNVGDAYIRDFFELRKTIINGENFGPDASAAYLGILHQLLVTRPESPRFVLDKSKLIEAAAHRDAGEQERLSHSKVMHPDLNYKVIEDNLSAARKRRLPKRYIHLALDQIRLFHRFKHKQLVELFKKEPLNLWQFELMHQFELFEMAEGLTYKLYPPAIAVDHNDPAQFIFGYWTEVKQKRRLIKHVDMFISKVFVDFCLKEERYQNLLIGYIARMLLEVAGSGHKQAVALERNISGKSAMGRESAVEDIFTKLTEKFVKEKEKVLLAKEAMIESGNKERNSSSPVNDLGIKNRIVEALEKNKGAIALDIFSREMGISRGLLEAMIRNMRSLVGVGEVIDIINPVNYFRTGFAKTREAIHIDGDWHRTDHILGVSEDGKRIVLQLRKDKEKRHGLFVTGHFGVGEGAQQALSREFEEEIAVIELDSSRLYRVGNNFVKVGRKDFSQKPGYYKENQDGYNGKVYMYQTRGSELYNREVSHLYVYVILKEEEKLLSRGVDTEEVAGISILTWGEFLQNVHSNPYGYHSAVWQYFSRSNIFKILRTINFSAEFSYLQKELNKLHIYFRKEYGDGSSSPVPVLSHTITEEWEITKLTENELDAQVKFYSQNKLVGEAPLYLDKNAASIMTCWFKSYQPNQKLGLEFAARVYLRASQMSGWLNFGTKFAHAYFFLSQNEERELDYCSPIALNRRQENRKHMFSIFKKLGMRKEENPDINRMVLSGPYGDMENEHVALLQSVVEFAQANWFEWYYVKRIEAARDVSVARQSTLLMKKLIKDNLESNEALLRRQTEEIRHLSIFSSPVSYEEKARAIQKVWENIKAEIEV